MKIQMPIKLLMGATLTLFALFGCSTGIDTDIADLGDRGKSLIGDGSGDCGAECYDKPLIVGGGSDVAEGYDKPLIGDGDGSGDCGDECYDKPLPIDPLPPPAYVPYEPEKPIPTPEIPDPTTPILNDLVKIWIGEQLASKSEEKREVVIVDLSDAAFPPVVKSMTALEILELIKNSSSITIKFNN